MHLAADPVADQGADDREALRLDRALDRGGDVAEVVARAASARRRRRAPPRVTSSSFARVGIDRPDRDRDRRVGDPAVLDHADVDREDVAALQLVGAGDAVDDHRVRRGADRAREAAVALEGRLAPCERMKFSAAASSSWWSRPGRAFAASIFRQRARISPAAAIFSICSGVLRMIIRYTLDRLVRLESKRRQGARNLGGDLVRRRRRRRSGAARSVVVVVDQRLGLLVVGLEPVADDLGLVVVADDAARCRRRRRRPRCSGGLNSTWKTWPFLAQVRRPPSRRTTSSSATSISSAAVSARPSSPSSASSASAWGTVRGKPSRMKPSAASSESIALGDHADDHLVGDEVAAVHVLLRGLARARSRSRTAARRMSPVA